MGLIIGIGNNRGGALVKPIIVDTLPTASADTMNKVYLVPSNSDTDMFDVYYTVESGGSYSWEQDGTVSREGFEIADNLTTNDATKALSAKQGKVLADAGAATAAEVTALGQKVLNNSIAGAGQTYVEKTIDGLIPGHTYRVYIKNPNWDMTGIAGASNFRFVIAGYTISEQMITPRLVAVYVGSDVEPYYDVTIQENTEYVVIGGRAVAGESIEFSIWDYTDIFANAARISSINDSLPLFVKRKKTKKDFVKHCDGFIAHNPESAGFVLSNNYETYIIPADGVIGLRATLADNSSGERFVCFWRGTNLTAANKDNTNVYRSINGTQQLVITDIPEGTKFISITNRTALLPDWDFEVFYENLPTPPKNVLLIDRLVNMDTNGGDLRDNPSYNNIRIATYSVCSFPRPGLKIKVKLPCNIDMYFWVSNPTNSYTIGTAIGWYKDGDEVALPDTAMHYRCVFAQRATNVSATLPASQIQEYIDKGLLYFEYEDDGLDVLARNAGKDVRIGAAKRNLVTLAEGMDSMFVFGHISDLHGDSVRFGNFMKYLSTEEVDAVINSGDAVLAKGVNYTTYIEKIAGGYNIPYFFCIGNHESSPTGYATLFTDFIQPLVTPYGYLKAANTPADDCYYYRDFASKKIRVIALNYYNGGVYDGAIGQAQINWFINTLASTPSGYGIIVTLHSPEDKVVASEPYDVFRQKVRVNTYQENGFYVGDRPIMHIVDAFIGRTTYSATYTDSGVEVSINADFSGISDDTIEFIAYVVGHRHEDWIGYYDHATNKQLSLGITCGIALYGNGAGYFSNQSDLPRGGIGACQDAFNVYAVDRVHKVVKVVRIGADLTFDFVPREYMEIPYAD